MLTVLTKPIYSFQLESGECWKILEKEQPEKKKKKKILIQNFTNNYLYQQLFYFSTRLPDRLFRFPQFFTVVNQRHVQNTKFSTVEKWPLNFLRPSPPYLLPTLNVYSFLLYIIYPFAGYSRTFRCFFSPSFFLSFFYFFLLEGGGRSADTRQRVSSNNITDHSVYSYSVRCRTKFQNFTCLSGGKQ